MDELGGTEGVGHGVGDIWEEGKQDGAEPLKVGFKDRGELDLEQLSGSHELHEVDNLQVVVGLGCHVDDDQHEDGDGQQCADGGHEPVLTPLLVLVVGVDCVGEVVLHQGLV